jgi:Zn-dependent protease
MFTDPGRSQWDWEFRILGIPVRVHPFFWLVAVILGQESLRLGMQYLLIWVACLFISILVHEMGHVLAARAFGVNGEIVLYSFGGLAIPASQMRSRGEHIMVCFAGPLAGFLLLGALLLGISVLTPGEIPHLKNTVLYYLNLPPVEAELNWGPTLKGEIINDLVWINLVWGLVNLLPIWPLDGGQISRDVFTALAPRNGSSIAFGISFVVASVVALHALMGRYGMQLVPGFPLHGDWWLVLMFGYLAVGSFMALQEEYSRSRWTDDHWTRWDDR